MMEGSAIAAMGALRAQVEERLLLNEDYRVLKALDRAIADVKGPVGAKARTEDAAAPANPNHLHQKLAEKYNSAAA